MVFFKRLLSVPIVKNLSILVLGTVLAQLVFIGFQVILRRVYSPSDFGAFAVYMSIVGIVATVSSLRYEQAIVLPKDDSQALSLVGLSILTTFGIGLLMGLFFYLFFDIGIQITSMPLEYANWLYFLPISVLLFSIYQALNYLLIRLKLFKASASNKVERRLAEGITQVAIGKMGISSGLVFGDMIGQFTNATVAYIKVIPFIKPIKTNFSQLKMVAIEYRHFPIENGIASLLNAFSLLLPTLFINRLFDTQTTGLFDLARLILIIPLSLMTTSMSQVILQRFTEYRNQSSSVAMPLLKIAGVLSLIAILFVLVVWIFSPALISLIFGLEWRESGVFARILVWAFALKFIVSPFNILFTVFEKLKWLAVWQVLYFSLIVMLVFIPVNEIHVFLYFYMAIEVVSSVASALLCLKLIRNYEQTLTEIKHP